MANKEIPKSIQKAAEKYVFEDNGMRWSNNDDTAGDNYGSFIEGALHPSTEEYYLNKFAAERALNPDKLFEMYSDCSFPIVTKENEGIVQRQNESIFISKGSFIRLFNRYASQFSQPAENLSTKRWINLFERSPVGENGTIYPILSGTPNDVVFYGELVIKEEGFSIDGKMVIKRGSSHLKNFFWLE